MMRIFLLTLAMLALPGFVTAQGVQPTPVDSSDARLDFIRPFANQLVSGDVAATRAMLVKRDPAAAENQQLVSQLAAMVERFGGDRYTVKGFLNGRGRDIVVLLAGRDGGSGHFAVVLDAETDQITGFVPVMLQGG